MIGIVATIAGLIHAFTVALTNTSIRQADMPRMGDWMGRAIKPTFILYTLLLATYYVIDGVDKSIIFTSAYAVAMTVHLLTKPQIERVPLSKNPRALDLVISKSTSRYLYVLLMPSMLIPTFMLAALVGS